MATNPVCEMTVDEKVAAGTSVYQGQTYYFCSPACRLAFEADPAAYVRPGWPPMEVTTAERRPMPSHAAPPPPPRRSTTTCSPGRG